MDHHTGTSAPATPGTAGFLPALRLFAAVLLVASAVLLFGLRLPVPGYATLAVALVVAALVDRALFRDLLLIAVGLVIISTISVEANISYPNMALMGIVLSAAASRRSGALADARSGVAGESTAAWSPIGQFWPKSPPG